MQVASLALIAALLTAPLARGHGDLHELIVAADKKIESAPGDPALLLERANLLRLHNQLDHALSDLSKVAKLDPSLHDRHILRAKVEIARENWGAAKTALNAYLRAQSKSSEGYYLRSMVELQLGGGNPDGPCLRDARLAIDLQDKPSLEYHLHHIQILILKGNKDAVESAFSSAKDSHGELPALQAVHAQWLAKTGNPEKAAVIYSGLRAATPTLTFHWWVEEASMWRDHNHAKAKSAERQAMAAWESLPEIIRARPAMHGKHQRFIQSISSIQQESP